VKGLPLKLRLLGVLVILRHPWRALHAWLRLHGLIRTPRVMWCPGCDYRTRRMPKVRAHVCENLDRRTRRRLARYANRKGTVKV
jgi:hypothetical protein